MYVCVLNAFYLHVQRHINQKSIFKLFNKVIFERPFVEI